MSETPKESIIKVPKDLVEKSCGVLMDLGGSASKIIYRSKKDYDMGKRRNKQKETLVDDGSGQFRAVIYPREAMDEMLDFVLENCDMTKNEDGSHLVLATGLGANKYKDLIETKLNARIDTKAEFSCFTNSLTTIVKTFPLEEAFVEHTPQAMEQGKDLIETSNIFMSLEGMGDWPIVPVVDDDLKGLDSDTKADFPCLMVVCGSAFILVKVEEDGTQKFVDVISIAGRYFLGSSAVMTGVRDYNELIKMMENSDGKSADLYTREMTSPDEEDTYSKLSQKNMLIFHLGKCNIKPREEIRDDDLVHSTAQLLCANLAQIAHTTAMARNIRRVFFCGSFVANELIQNHLLCYIYARNYMTEKKKRVRVDILKHGGFLGALGTLLS